MILKSTLIGATAIAIALTSFDLRPAAAAPEGGAAIAKQKVGADELSAARKRRRQGVHPGVPLAAFGAIIGTIGAVDGTQPFGGSGLSGTGPKAGGPNYLRRFATEQVVTVNTAAAGGNASLLAEGE